MEYISVKAAAEKYGVSPRWIQKLCGEGKIEGAMKLEGSGIWLIPKEAEIVLERKNRENKAAVDTAYQAYLHYFLSKEKREPFVIKKGRGKVLISAPHSVEQTREGRIKYGEYQTGILANMLFDRLGCHIAYKTFNNGDDANYDRVCAYKKAVSEFVRENGIRFLIDLHQLAPRRVENIDIGTGFGENIRRHPEFSDIVNRAFAAQGIDNITVDTPFDASYPYTVSAYISRLCEIPCIQIEINSRLVCDGCEDFCFDKILSALTNIVNRLNGK